MSIDYTHLRELAEAVVEPMEDIGDPYSPVSVHTAVKYVMAQRQFESAVTPLTVIAILDERDALQARIDAALVQVGDTVIYVPDDEDADPDWEAAYMEGAEHVKLRLRRILTTPTENGEEQ